MIRWFKAKWSDPEFLPRVIIEIGGVIIGLPVAAIWLLGPDYGSIAVLFMMLFLLGGLIMAVAQHNGV